MRGPGSCWEDVRESSEVEEGNGSLQPREQLLRPGGEGAPRRRCMLPGRFAFEAPEQAWRRDSVMPRGSWPRLSGSRHRRGSSGARFHGGHQGEIVLCPRAGCRRSQANQPCHIPRSGGNDRPARCGARGEGPRGVRVRRSVRVHSRPERDHGDLRSRLLDHSGLKRIVSSSWTAAATKLESPHGKCREPPLSRVSRRDGACLHPCRPPEAASPSVSAPWRNLGCGLLRVGRRPYDTGCPWRGTRRPDSGVGNEIEAVDMDLVGQATYPVSLRQLVSDLGIGGNVARLAASRGGRRSRWRRCPP